MRKIWKKRENLRLFCFRDLYNKIFGKIPKNSSLINTQTSNSTLLQCYQTSENCCVELIRSKSVFGCPCPFCPLHMPMDAHCPWAMCMGNGHEQKTGWAMGMGTKFESEKHWTKLLTPLLSFNIFMWFCCFEIFFCVSTVFSDLFCPLRNLFPAKMIKI